MHKQYNNPINPHSTLLPNSLPYQQLTFILTETIGLPKSNQSPSQGILTDQELNKYKDVLVPVSVGSISLGYLYYLFHVAPVYNWLRNVQLFGNTKGRRDEVSKDSNINADNIKGCLQRQLLQQYINNTLRNSRVTPTTTKPVISPHPSKISPLKIKQKLVSQCRKLQILKKCMMNKIYITKLNNTQRNKNICRHMIKIQMWSQWYSYNYKREDIIVERYYCKQCDSYVNLDNAREIDGKNYQIRQYALAPIFNQYYGQTINVKPCNDSNTCIKYILHQIYTPTYVLIKSANGLSYKSQPITSTISNSSTNNYGNNQQQIIFNNMEIINLSALISNFQHSVIKSKANDNIFVYIKEDMVVNCGILKIAKSLYNIENIESKNQKMNKKSILEIFSKNANQKQKNSNHKITNKEKEKREKINNIMLKEQILHFNQQKNLTVQQKRPNQEQQKTMNQNRKTSVQATTQKKHTKQKTEKSIDNVNEMLEQIPDTPYNPYNNIVIADKQSKVGQKYKQQIEKLYIRPKEKDQLEKDYDKGKTKKIKKKIQYFNPNYNTLFKQVKQQNIQKMKQADEALKEGITLRQFEKKKERQQKQLESNMNQQNNRKKSNFQKSGKLKGRKAYKKWKKQKKQALIKKFQES